MIWQFQGVRVESLAKHRELANVFLKPSLPLEMTLRTIATLLPLLMLPLLPGCTTLTPAERRVDKNPDLFAKLPESEKPIVLRGDIVEGMSRDAVFLSWGRPGQVASGSRDGKNTEKWAYFSNAPVSTVSMGFGSYGSSSFYSSYGIHPEFGYSTGPGWGYGSGVDYLPYPDSTIEFVDGRVVAWEKTH